MSKKSTLLIVDDEVANIEIMNAVLEAQYEICFATSGEEALELARDVLPDLILPVSYTHLTLPTICSV